MSRALLSALALLPLCLSPAFAGDQVGTLTQVEGDVMVFFEPSKTLQKESNGTPRALFGGEYFRVRPAKAGDRVEKGNILRTAPAAKARVVYPNGDQLNVGPATSYRIFWDKDAADGQTNVSLMYGKLRGVVEKGGPRSRLTIRTRAAVMGVRGTDFFIAESGADGETEISVLRGSVEVKPEAPAKGPAPKPIEIKSGYAATIPPPAPVAQTAPAPQTAKPDETPAPDATSTPAPVTAPMSATVELRKITQEDLVGIQRSSVITAPKAAPSLPEPVAQEIKKLETQALATTLNDIKTHDPKLYAQLEPRLAEKKIESVTQLNTTAVETLLKTAPKAPAKRKPYKSELEDLENGAYEKYFKILD